MNWIKPQLLLIALLAMSSIPAAAENDDQRPPPTPLSESRMNRAGFDGMLLVTPDKDWKEKWNTPPATAPHFTTANEVRDGGELWVLLFFSNPQPDAQGKVDITCDVLLLRPDGSRSQDVADQPCFSSEMPGNPRMVFLADIAVGILAEPTDPRGKWIAKLTIRDNVRGVELPLQTWFDIK